jgi:hypothetical protein
MVSQLSLINERSKNFNPLRLQIALPRTSEHECYSEIEIEELLRRNLLLN